MIQFYTRPTMHYTSFAIGPACGSQIRVEERHVLWLLGQKKKKENYKNREKKEKGGGCKGWRGDWKKGWREIDGGGL